MLIVLVFSLLFLGSAPTVFAQSCTRWASPTGGGNGMSQNSPFTVRAFLNQAGPGQVLCLLDGRYTGTNGMLEIPSGLSGQQGNPITVRALNDGGAWLDGEYTEGLFKFPVYLEGGSSWWVFEGFDAGNAPEAVISMSLDNSVHHITFRRICAFNANLNPRPGSTKTNMHTWNPGGNDNLFEDICGFGWGRNNFVDGNTKRQVVRRAWMRWEGGDDGVRQGVRGEDWAPGGGPFQLDYSANIGSFAPGEGHDTIYENMIGIWSANLEEQFPPGGCQHDVTFAMRTGLRNAASYPNHQGNLIAGGIFYAYPDLVYNPCGGSDETWGRIRWAPNRVVDLFMDVRPYTHAGVITLGCDLAGNGEFTESVDCNRVRYDRVTGWKGSTGQSDGFPGPTTNFRTCTGGIENCPSPFTGQGGSGPGSRACYEYENGVLQDGTGGTTAKPLWPWRMDDRIKQAIERSRLNQASNLMPPFLSGSAGPGYQAGTVTSEIAARYAPNGIPSQCLRGGTPVTPKTRYIGPGGSDSNSCDASETQSTRKLTLTGANGALSCIQSGIGDTLVVLPGTYNECLNDAIPSGGTGAPTIIRSQTPSGATLKPTFQCGNTSVIYLNNKQEITIDGFIIDLSGTPSAPINDGGIWMDGSTNNVIVQSVEITGMGVPGPFGGCGICGSPLDHNNTVRNSWIHGLATANTDASAHAACVDIQGNTNMYENILCHNVAWRGFSQVNAGAASSNNTFRNNTIHHTGASGMVVGSGTNNEAYNNVIYLTGQGNSAETVNLNSGVAATGTKFWFNTLFDGAGPALVIQGGTNTEVRNNILYSNSVDTINNTGTTTTCSNTLTSAAAVGMTCLSSVLSSNPLFQSEAGADLRLAPGSPAINAGTAVSTVTTDRTGSNRIQGAAPDIGAYEFISSVVPATYYVAETGGLDSRSCTVATNRTTPKRNIMGIQGALACLQAGAGDVLNIGNGVYPERIDSTLQFINSGTSFSSPVIIQADPQNPVGTTVTLNPTLTSGQQVVRLTSQQYVIMNGLILDAGNVGGNALLLDTNSHHIRFQGGQAKKSVFSPVLIRGGNNEILNSTIQENAQEHCLWVAGGNANTIENNDLSNCQGNGIRTLPASGSLSDTIIRGNRIHASNPTSVDAAILVGDASGALVVNNIIDANCSGIEVAGGTNGARIYHNTITSNQLFGIQVDAGASDCRLFNNGLWQNGTVPPITNNGTSTVQDRNRTDNPVFVAAGAGDFHLMPGSLWIDAGVTLLDVPTDKAGASRQQGSAPDIGAFEMPPGVQAPSAPSAFRLKYVR